MPPEPFRLVYNEEQPAKTSHRYLGSFGVFYLARSIMLPDLDRYAIYRILDANYNRATEGIRTLEEIARFQANSTLLQRELKSLRHKIAAAHQLLPAEELLKSRSASGDVGPENTLDSEMQRTSLEHIQNAASQRIQQALRALEEFSKPLHPQAASAFGKVRYLAYDVLAKSLLSFASHKVEFAAARIYLLVDLKRNHTVWLDHLEKLVEAGADIIQVRDKHADGAVLLERCQQAVERLAKTPARLIVNDRPDIALMCGADGVHVGQEDLPVSSIRKWVGQRLSIGLSTHTPQQVAAAESLNVDYIGCGPTFPSTTKQFESFSGIEFLKAAANTPLPCFAIGGITLEKLPQVIEAGFQRVALAGDVDQAHDPYQRVREFRKRLC